MRHVSFPLVLILLLLLQSPHAGAQASASSVFTANLSLGSSGAQVVALQKILNRALDTRIASAGAGSPGNETGYFGALTKAAVARFQEKYASEILVPVGLARGNGRVGLYTRARLNALPASTSTISAVGAPAILSPVVQSVPASTTTSTSVTTYSTVQSVPESATTSTSVVATSVANYLVSDSEKIDIYAGDTMLAKVRDKIYAAINSAIVSQSTGTIVLPVVTLEDVPSVAVGELSPHSGIPGAHVSITGTGISPNSVVYFGSTYIVRTVSRDPFGNFSFTVPPIPPLRYDVAVRTGDDVSNTTTFVITDSRNPLVRIQSVSPSTIPYGGTLMIIGSGFTPQGNVVVTTYQKFTDVSSPDGKTLTVRLAPASLQASAKVGDGTKNIPMSLYVVNDYGFSYMTQSFTMTI